MTHVTYRTTVEVVHDTSVHPVTELQAEYEDMGRDIAASELLDGVISVKSWHVNVTEALGNVREHAAALTTRPVYFRPSPTNDLADAMSDDQDLVLVGSDDHVGIVFGATMAERITKCLDACLGIENDQLEPKMLGDQIAAKFELIDDQNRLIDVLKDIVDVLENDQDWQAALRFANAALSDRGIVPAPTTESNP